MKRSDFFIRGSFTVEAAFIIPVILFVIFGSLTLFFHVHNRAWLTAAAYESAVNGSISAYSSDSEAFMAASVKSRYLIHSGFFNSENLHTYTSVGPVVKVSYSMDTVSSFGGLRWPVQVSGEAPVLRPVPWIRRLKSGYQVLSGG